MEEIIVFSTYMAFKALKNKTRPLSILFPALKSKRIMPALMAIIKNNGAISSRMFLNAGNFRMNKSKKYKIRHNIK
jgi:hypothetical protein